MSIVAASISGWTPEITMHDSAIDREHEEIFGFVDRLHKAMLSGQRKEILGALLAELTEFTMSHFANEEKIMAAMRYPEMPAHVQQHDRIRRIVKEMKARFERGEAAMTIELILFLSDWLKNHTTTTDLRLGDYIQVEQKFTAYLERLMSGDHRGCRVIVQDLLAKGISFKDLYVSLFQRAMYHSGELWMMNKISVATEHLATTITQSMMALVHPTLLNSPRNGKRVVVSCVGGELHQLGAQMVSDTFEFLGWDSYFLGANTPVEDLLGLIGEKQPAVLCLSVSLSSHIPLFKETVKKTHARFPGLEILAGGQAFLQSRTAVDGDPHVRYLVSLDELETWIAGR